MTRYMSVCRCVCVIGAAVWKYGALFSPKAYVSEGGRQRNKNNNKNKEIRKNRSTYGDSTG